MKKILTILGQEVTIMFNMAVQISFEEITGKPFSEIDTNVSKDSLALAYSAIIANNPDCNITVDNLMHDASGAELNAVIKAISDSFVEWNKEPKNFLLNKFQSFLHHNTNQVNYYLYPHTLLSYHIFFLSFYY